MDKADQLQLPFISIFMFGECNKLSFESHYHVFFTFEKLVVKIVLLSRHCLLHELQVSNPVLMSQSCDYICKFKSNEISKVCSGTKSIFNNRI